MSDPSALALTCRLIHRNSVTPDDAGCLDLMAQRLEPLGFTLERMDGAGPTGKISNLWARRGKAAPLLCFAGHTDVVPTGPLEHWTYDPFTPTEHDGFLYGRGAADMKTSLAAFVVAAERFVHMHPQHHGSLALLLTSDEEGDAIQGTVKVVEALKQRDELIDYCVVGEPTSAQKFGDTIKNGRRGSLSALLVVKGIQGHIAYPEQVRNPVLQAAPALAELAATRWDDGNEFFPATSFQVSNAHAGTGATNVVPGTFEIQFNFRFSTASTPEDLQQRVLAILDRHGLEYEIRWTLGGKPFLTRPGKLVTALSESIRAHAGVTPQLSTSGGTSDGRFIADICAEVVEFGPINATIHKIDERVAIADIEPLAHIYQGVMKRLLA